MAQSEAEPRGASPLELKSLRKEYDVPDGVEVAVDSFSLRVGETEFVTLVGPSGCGKTTTLRCIAGLETPTSGSIEMYGRDLTPIPANKRNLAMMFQNIALYPHMKVIDNIAYPLKVRGKPKSERYAMAEEAAEIMQIEGMLDKYPGDLSGGQRQRAALARTIVQDPEAFLMDEPLSDLDAKLKMEIRKVIQRVHRRVEKPTIYVTHDQEEAMTMSDRIVVMNDGNIEQIGTPDELYQRPESRFVAEFIGNPTMNFLSAEVTDLSDDTAVVDVEDRSIEFEITDPAETATPVAATLGFRPTKLELEPDPAAGDVTGVIQLVERTGEEMLATIEGPQGEIRAILPVDSPFDEDDEVGITIDRSRIHLFFEESGAVLANGAGL